MREYDWRAGLARLARLWRTSLQLRTVAISVVMATVGVSIIGAYMSVSVGTNLFDSRRDQLLSSSERAAVSVQAVFNAAVEQGGAVDLESAMVDAFDLVARSSATTGGTLIAILRTTNQEGPRVPQDVASTPADVTVGVISADLRDQVAESASGDRRVFWQSVSIPGDDGETDPGIVVGSSITIPSAGAYELYMVYNLSDAQQTLDFVQRTLVLGLLALIVL
ncbi:MAG TPA: sensor histidine kinase, partial [Glaciihabitans sp.]|nr:sensor histidine kinase [Glaciihabitans sp.]